MQGCDLSPVDFSLRECIGPTSRRSRALTATCLTIGNCTQLTTSLDGTAFPATLPSFLTVARVRAAAE
jgi:hypothetical protein